VALTSVVKKTPFKEFCELSVQTRGCARGVARPSILRSVSSCAQAVVLDKDVVRRALDGQIDRQRGWVSCLRWRRGFVCRERYHGGSDQCSKKDTFQRVLWVERANARMRERGSASVDPALRVVVRAGGRTRQRRSPAGTRRADNEQKRVLRRLRVTLQGSGRQLFQWLNSFCLPTMLFSCWRAEEVVPTQDNLGGCRSGAKQRRGCISTTVSAGEATEARETFAGENRAE